MVCGFDKVIQVASIYELDGVFCFFNWTWFYYYLVFIFIIKFYKINFIKFGWLTWFAVLTSLTLFFSILSIDIKLIENWVIAVSKKYLNIGLVFDFMIVYFCYYIVFKKQIIIPVESITRFAGGLMLIQSVIVSISF
jgi:hypothetical protein